MSASKEDLCCNPQRRPRTSRRNKMGRPLNKRFFGTPTADGNEIRVQFNNGANSVNGWIVKQLGSKKFRCTDGTAIKDCFLVDKSAADANTPAVLVEGEMTMTVKDDTGALKQVVKITARKVTVDTGESLPWNFSDSTEDNAVEMEEAGVFSYGLDGQPGGGDDTQTGEDDFESDGD